MLQTLLGETFVLLEELLLDGPQLLAKQVFIRQLDRRENDGAEYEIEKIPQDQGDKIPRRFVTLYQTHAGIAGERLKHLQEVDHLAVTVLL